MNRVIISLRSRYRIARIFFIIFCCLIILAFAKPSLALTIQDVPNPRQVNSGWITDMSDLLDRETEIQLNQKISRLEASNSSEIAVVTVTETAPSATPKQLATDLFNYWGIGKKGKNNGVLVLISQSDRRIEIETGYGVRELLSNTFLQKLIEGQILPSYKQGNFNTGTQAAIDNIILALRKPNLPKINTTQNQNQYDNQETRQVFLGLAIAFAIASIIIFIAIIVFQTINVESVEPEGLSRINQSIKDLKLNCSKCQQLMEQIDDVSLSSYLTESEKIAQKIGSLSFQGWRCLNCQTNSNVRGIHIRSYITSDKSDRKFKNCPNCQELTIEIISKVTKKPTSKIEGQRLITEKCHCCFNREEILQTIPRISYSSSSSFGYSDGGNYGGGRDFGGGSSGGDGGGGSW